MFALFRLLLLAFCFSLTVGLVACSDDDSSAEFLFDREISDLSVLRQCAKGADSGAYCFMVRFRYPIDTDHLERIYLWVDSLVVGDTAKAVSDGDLEEATDSFEYAEGTEALFDTIDLTSYIQDYTKVRDSLLIAIYCDYSSGRPGTVQRIYLHFGDDLKPSLVNYEDSVWTTGYLMQWTRSTDQTDYYKPGELSGPIVGYNIEIYTQDKDEDIRDLSVKVISPDGTDSTGTSIYKRHHQLYRNNDSMWVDTTSHGDRVKNYLRIMVKDGKGYNEDEPDSNMFRLIVDGLKAESKYTITITAWDSSGNRSDNATKDFVTTDSVAPLMPTKLFTLKDTLYPDMARLDSNNRLRIFWSQSVDPYKKSHNIEVDSVLTLPDTCVFKICYDTVSTYMIEYYDVNQNKWTVYKDTGATSYGASLYEVSGDTMEISAVGSFVTDTIRWVAPGDTLILRVRAIDKSKYYSVALIDTIYVAPSAYAAELECPEGFVPVKSSDTSFFCMERLEHRNDSGAFMTNVLHSDALAACEAVSASGFTVSLCNERDWELVCLSGGTLSYGVVQEDILQPTDLLFKDCNVASNDSASAADITKRSPRCMNPMGVRDMPGQYQEWVMGRSEDTLAVVKGGSYKVMGGLDLETQALCTNRSFPYFTRLGYTKDTVYLYREGTKVDTVFVADTSRSLYQILTQKDFKDSLQFFDVQDSSGNSVGTDYAPYSEYKKGGDKWLESIGNGMKYVPDHIEVVFLTGEKVAFRGAANFYKSPTIGFRCCAYKE